MIERLEVKCIISPLASTSYSLSNIKAISWYELLIPIRELESAELQVVDTIGGKLKYLRTLNGISQRELELKLELTVNTITSIEDRGRYPNRAVSKKLATFFNVGTTYFYDERYEIDIAPILKQYRQKTNINIVQASKIVNVGSQTWTNWEEGSTISMNNFVKLKRLGIIP